MTAVEDAFAGHAETFHRAARVLPTLVGRAVDLIEAALSGGGTVLTVGNGGSAADAQHLASELVGRYVEDRAPWRAVSLTVDPSAVTAIANDYGFDHVFSRQVEALARPGDVLVAFSTSGRSPNVVSAARTARALGVGVVAFSGADPAELGTHADVAVPVPSTSVPRIQEVHGLCIHAVVAELEERASIR